jgi:hypothetical protein
LPFQTGLSPFRTPGQSTFFRYLAPADTTGATTVFTHERATRVNPQLYYYYESIGLLTEYMWLKQGVQKGNTNLADLTQQSAAVTASYTINGRENYDGTTPLVGFDREKGTWGALVLAARWSWLSMDEATFPTYANPVASARDTSKDPMDFHMPSPRALTGATFNVQRSKNARFVSRCVANPATSGAVNRRLATALRSPSSGARSSPARSSSRRPRVMTRTACPPSISASTAKAATASPR